MLFGHFRNTCVRSILKVALPGIVLAGFGAGALYLGVAHAADPKPVTFYSLDGKTRLAAYLLRPRLREAVPAAVLLHGCSGLFRKGRLTPRHEAWARHLAETGVAALLVDSAGPRGFRATCGPGKQREAMYRSRPKDAYAALAYLQTQDFIRAGRIALIGWSQGGGIVLLSIVRHSIGRPDPLAGPDFRAAIAFYPSTCSDRLQSRPYTAIAPQSWTTDIPLRVLQGGADNWTPAARCVEFINAARERGAPVAIKVYPGALHGFDAPDSPRRVLWSYSAPDGTAPVTGTHPAARAQAMKDVSAFLARELAPN